MSASKRTSHPAAASSADFPRLPFIHPLAAVDGLVTLGEGCSIWAGAVLRADMNTIRLGPYVNIQDNTTLHTDSRSSIEIGDYTLVGHNAMLHGCRIGRGCMIGIGSIVLDHAEIGDGAMVTAGCLIRGGKKIPAGALVLSKGEELRIVPGGAKTALTIAGSLEYAALARRFLDGVFGPFSKEEELSFLEQARELIEKLGLDPRKAARDPASS